MSKIEKQELLKNMHERTKKATKSKKAAIAYLAELGMLNKDGSYSATYLDLYQKQSGLIIGFHGCDSKVQKEAILSSKNILLVSNNAYDWLGHGIYFWENSPERALEFARESSKRNKNKFKNQRCLVPLLM